LRHQRQERWLEDLQQRLAETLVDLPCRVWLFGSRARGDWDGLSDTDLLVEAEAGELAERARNDLELAELVQGDGFDAQACFFATEAAEKALKGTILQLGCEPAHNHVLGRLVERLAAAGLDVTALASLRLAALS
jgi:predicted nucleotidyltransferase